VKESTQDYSELTIVIDAQPESVEEEDTAVEISDEEEYAEPHGQESSTSDDEDPGQGEQTPSSQAQEEAPQAPARTSSLPTASHQDVPGVSRTYNLRPRRKEPENSATGNYAEALNTEDEPSSFDQIKGRPDVAEWKNAMQEEYRALVKNETWDLVPLPKGRTPISCKWVYKLKRHLDGTIERYKARLVARGFSQRAGIDYGETFSPVVRLDTVRILLSVAAVEDLDIMHFDVKTAFLHGQLEEDIFMQQPEGFVKGKGMVCKLKKSLYGLKQASRSWNKTFTDFLLKFDLKPLKKDSCVFVRHGAGTKSGSTALIVALYVDDGLVLCNNLTIIDDVMRHLKSKFEITVMDPKCFIGLQIYRDRPKREIFVNQSFYINRIIERFNMSEAKTASTPFDYTQRLGKVGAPDGKKHIIVDVPYREAIGSLLYASQGSRPDISFAVSFLSRFCSEPTLAHWRAVKRVMQYLKDKPNLGLHYSKSGKENQIVAFADADHAMDIDTRHSTTGYVVLLNGGPIVWRTKKQSIIAASTTEAEFVAASVACREILWARQLMSEIGREQCEPTNLYVDNQSAICLISNQQLHEKTKHIQIKYLLVQEAQEKGWIKVQYVRSDEQKADMFTKGLSKGQLTKLICAIGMACVVLNQVDVLSAMATGGEKVKYRMVLNYLNPCEEIFKVEHKIDYPYGFWYFKDQVMKECNAQYKDKWEFAVSRLQRCVVNPVSRKKRDIAGTLITLFGNAATNLVTSYFQQAEQKQKDVMIKEFYNSYDMNGMHQASARDYVKICNEASNNHVTEPVDEAQALPGIDGQSPW